MANKINSDHTTIVLDNLNDVLSSMVAAFSDLEYERLNTLELERQRLWDAVTSCTFQLDHQTQLANIEKLNLELQDIAQQQRQGIYKDLMMLRNAKGYTDRK